MKMDVKSTDCRNVVYIIKTETVILLT